MDIEKVKQRIKKLLNMANASTNEGEDNINEAAIALKRANKLMHDYQLEMVDVIATELKNGDGLTSEEFQNLSFKSWPLWLQTITIHVCNLYDCKASFKQDPVKLGRNRVLVLMGYNSDVEMVKWTLEYLYLTLNRLAKNATKELKGTDSSLKIRNSFLVGATNVLRERLKEMANQKQEVITSDSTELMVLKKQAVEEKYGKFGYGNRSYSNANHEAYSKGVEAGSKIDFNKVIGDSHTTNRLDVKK